MEYKKDERNLLVQYINGDNEDVVYEIKSRNWTNVGELLTEVAVNRIFEQNLKGKTKPKNLLVAVTMELTLTE